MSEKNPKEAAMWLHPAIRLAKQMGLQVPETSLFMELSNKIMEQLAILDEDAIDKLGIKFWEEYDRRIEKGFSIQSKAAIKAKADKLDKELSEL